MALRQQKFSIWYTVLAIVLLLLIQSVFSAPHTQNLSYSEFKALVKKGMVDNLVLSSETITGTLSTQGLEDILPEEKIKELKHYGEGEHRFVTARVDDPGLVRELEAANVRFTGRGCCQP